MTTEGWHWYVNLWQTKEERQEKYWLARSCGLPASQCRVLRDWRLKRLEIKLRLVSNSAEDSPVSQPNILSGMAAIKNGSHATKKTLHNRNLVASDS